MRDLSSTSHDGADVVAPEDPPRWTSRASRLGYLALHALFFLMMLRLWAPFDLDQVRDGLDPSWGAVLAEAAGGRFGFGRDIFFTGGPLSYFYTRYYRPELLSTFLALGLSATAFCAFTGARIARLGGAPGYVVLAMVSGMAVLTRDAVLLLVPLLAVYGHLADPEGRGARAILAVGAIAAAICTLAKFSLLPLALAGFFVADALALARRRAPVGLVTYALALVVSFRLLEGPGATFVEFLRGSLSTSSGYAEAMSVPTRPREMAWFAVAVGCFVLGAALAVRARVRRLQSRDARRAAVWTIATWSVPFAVYVWISFKAGYVRSDVGHVPTALAAVPLGGSIFAYGILGRMRDSIVGAVFVVASVAVSLTGIAVIYHERGYAPSVGVYAEWGVKDAVRVLETCVSSALHPHAWKRSLDEARRSALARLSLDPAFESARGTMATIEWNQSVLVTQDVEFLSFPSVQEYTSYTPYAIARDRAFLRDPNGPEHVIFRPNTIDERYPTMAAGPLWPDLLARYRPTRVGNGSILLTRRRAVVTSLERQGASGRAALGREIAIDAGDDVVIVRPALSLSVVGRLRAFLYKVPRLQIVVTTSDGQTKRYRYIREIGRAGFVISPVVATSLDYLLMASGVGPSPSTRVRSFRIEAENGRDTWFERDFTYTTTRISSRRLAEDARGWDAAAVRSAVEDIVRLRRIVADNGGVDTTRHFVPEGLLVHPDQTLRVASDGARRLGFVVGIRPDVYDVNPPTDGVCIAFTALPSRLVVGARCIRPVSDPRDRGDQVVPVELPPGSDAVELVVGAGGNLAYDWFYIRRIEMLAH